MSNLVLMFHCIIKVKYTRKVFIYLILLIPNCFTKEYCH